MSVGGEPFRGSVFIVCVLMWLSANLRRGASSQQVTRHSCMGAEVWFRHPGPTILEANQKYDTLPPPFD